VFQKRIKHQNIQFKGDKMKLYYAPDTCSLSPHIVLRELELEFELVKVDNRASAPLTDAIS
jgi:hypothetical protein